MNVCSVIPCQTKLTFCYYHHLDHFLRLLFLLYIKYIDDWCSVNYFCASTSSSASSSYAGSVSLLILKNIDHQLPFLCNLTAAKLGKVNLSFSACLQRNNLLKTSWKDVSKTSCKTSWKKKNCYAEDVFKSS